MKKPLLLLAAMAVVLFVLILGKNVPATPENARAYAQRPILAFGDSLTFGTGVEPHLSYPAMLQRMSGVKVVNAGVPGETSAQGLKRLEGALREHRPAMLILCHGGNDVLRGLSRSALKENLAAMVRIAQKENVDVLLVGLPDMSTLGFGDLDLYEEVAETYGTMFESGVIGKIERNAALKSDRIHPNAEGYRMMAETFYEILKSEYRL